MDATAYDAIPDVVVIIDADNVIRTANAQCEALLGYEPAELVGKPLSVLIPERFDNHGKQVEMFARDPEVRSMGKGEDLYARAKNGEEISVDIALGPVVFPDGSHGVLATVRDARPRTDAEERLRIQAVALESAANGVVITNADGIIAWANPAVSRMTGYDLDELVGHHSRILKSGSHDEAFYRELWETVTRGETWVGEIINRRKDGQLYYEEQTIAPVRDHNGKINHFIAIKLDVTERRETEAALRQAHDQLEVRLAEIKELTKKLRGQAIRDPLTSLFNRRYLDEMLSRELARAIRSKQPLSAVLLDVDHFKLVNDHFGHEVGDQFLVALSKILRTQARTSDIACRFGGEEFVVIMPGATPEIATQRANSWREKFSEIVVGRTGAVPRCTLSAGVAGWNGPDELPRSLLKRADEAMYAAKRAGRNQIVTV